MSRAGWWGRMCGMDRKNSEESPRRLVRDIRREGGAHEERSRVFHEIEQVELLSGEAKKIDEDPRVKKAVEDDVEEDKSGNEMVRLRLEYISERESKQVFYWLSFALVTAIALMATTIALNERFWKSGAVFIFSIAWSGLMLIYLMATLLQCIVRFHLALKSGKKWSIRQKRTTLLNYTIVLFTAAVVLLGLVSNIYGQVRTCNISINVSLALFFPRRILIILIFFLNNVLGLDHVVDKNDPKKLYMDSSCLVHLPHALITAGLIVINAVEFGMSLSEDHSELTNWHKKLLQCENADNVSRCSIQGFDLVVMITTYVGILILFIMYVAILILALKRLSKLPWEEHRYSNVGVRIMAWTSLLTYFPLLLLGLVRIATLQTHCDDLLHSLYGVQDELILFTVWATLRAYLYAPKYTTHGGSSFRQAYLQNFILTEDCTYGSKIFWYKDPATRFAPVPYGPHPTLMGQPVFCLETAAKALFWSRMVYIKEEDAFYPQLKAAMNLCGLTEYRIFHDSVLDIKAVVAWGDDKVVVCFRGSKSAVNFLEDLKVWRTRHPRMPVRGRTVLGRWYSECLVHSGFLTCFEDSRVGDKVVRLVYSLCAEQAHRSILFTGHSLGGALSQLCAFEIGIAHHNYLQLSCYTLGCPRIGNGPAAKEIERVVPCLWNLVNDNDLVYRGGKLFKSYKHAGLPVQLISRGDLIVRPSYAEAALHHAFFHWSLVDHRLQRYKQSMRKFCERTKQTEKVLDILSRCPTSSPIL